MFVYIWIRWVHSSGSGTSPLVHSEHTDWHISNRKIYCLMNQQVVYTLFNNNSHPLQTWFMLLFIHIRHHWSKYIRDCTITMNNSLTRYLLYYTCCHWHQQLNWQQQQSVGTKIRSTCSFLFTGRALRFEHYCYYLIFICVSYVRAGDNGIKDKRKKEVTLVVGLLLVFGLWLCNCGNIANLDTLDTTELHGNTSVGPV